MGVRVKTWLANYWRRSLDELRTKTFWRDVFSEFLGTFFLVATQCSLLINWHNRSPGGAVMNGLGMGFMVTVLVAVFGDFGGAHLNPAVTVPMMTLGKCLFIRGIFYIIVQLAGGVLSAGLIFLLTPENFRGDLGVTKPGAGVEYWQDLGMETWITCSLVMTILASTNSRRKMPTYMAAVPIGFAVGVGLFVGYGYSGGSMNPARSFGPAVILNYWEYHWVYWVGPIGGGLLAVLFYSVMLDHVDKPQEDKPIEIPVTTVCTHCLEVMDGAVTRDPVDYSTLPGKTMAGDSTPSDSPSSRGGDGTETQMDDVIPSAPVDGNHNGIKPVQLEGNELTDVHIEVDRL